MMYSVGEGYRSPRAGHVIVIKFAETACTTCCEIVGAGVINEGDTMDLTVWRNTCATFYHISGLQFPRRNSHYSGKS